ncbi:hypothetical protein [Nocardioides albus]|uniref:Uncharacterized protein n=1 Tax=Nocardioides albus TaxID=1841 RepID=A0A7W5FBK7_9ACTN|nr:hypothetical protein [Nocardioides albus]MBB3092337.1 hypothetical protein [Nocardioides albus]GGU26608.1 hypothetical protein GCM10007979_27000 [Nocardioides albus]
MSAPISEGRGELAQSLREWARGLYSLEAAVELLIWFNHGRLLDGSWIEHDSEGARYWFSADMVPTDGGELSGGERRVLEIAASLAEPSLAKVGLGDGVTGLDRDALDLILAAIAHAGGSHEHSRPVFGLDGTYAGTRELPTLHDWPTGRFEDVNHTNTTTENPTKKGTK